MPDWTPPIEDPLRGLPAWIAVLLWLVTINVAMGAVAAFLRGHEQLGMFLGIAAAVGLGVMLAWRRKRPRL